jgi:hypothetical protein
LSARETALRWIERTTPEVRELGPSPMKFLEDVEATTARRAADAVADRLRAHGVMGAWRLNVSTKGGVWWDEEVLTRVRAHERAYPWRRCRVMVVHHNLRRNHVVDWVAEFEMVLRDSMGCAL